MTPDDLLAVAATLASILACVLPHEASRCLVEAYSHMVAILRDEYGADLGQVIARAKEHLGHLARLTR
jgi:hypothetical protein